MDKKVIKAYKKRKEYYAKADKLWKEAGEIWTRLSAKEAESKAVTKIVIRSGILYAKGNIIRSEGNLQFYNAVATVYGEDSTCTFFHNGFKVNNLEYKE